MCPFKEITPIGIIKNICLYRHAIMLYKLMRNELCDNELMWLNFQIVDNARSQTWSFTMRHNYDVGKNTLINRMYFLNGRIEKNWINLSLDTYKVKCKEKFLLSSL